MDIIDKIVKYFDTEVDDIYKHNQAYQTLKTDILFINETLEVLESDNFAHKKNYFIDNQEYITDSLKSIQSLVKNSPNYETLNHSCFILDVTKLLTRLEEGINKFNQELTRQVSSSTVKEEIHVTEDTIKDAIQNNESTMQIVKDLENPNNVTLDEKTAQIQKDFQSLVNQKKVLQQRPQMPQNAPVCGFLIASQDFSESKIVSGNVTKSALNQMIEKSGIDNAKVFKLTEVHTKKKTVQKTITYID